GCPARSEVHTTTYRGGHLSQPRCGSQYSENDGAASERIDETPPRRSSTAPRNPPPTVTRSCRKRNTSKRFDFPEAFGPTRNTRRWSSTSTFVKLRQFSRWSRVKRKPCRGTSCMTSEACIVTISAQRSVYGGSAADLISAPS